MCIRDRKKADRKNGKKPPKRKFLDTYCENLTRKAREGKLDDIIEMCIRDRYRLPVRTYAATTPKRAI